MPLEPVPMSPTRFPVKSTPSRGHVAVKYTSPSKPSRPGMSGAIGADRHPTAVTRKRAVTVSSWSVRISQRFARVVERGRGHAGGELDVASEIEAIGDVVEVPLDLGLLRVPTRPLPLVRPARGRTSSSSSSSRSHSARRDSDSSTTCRRRHRLPRRRARSCSSRRETCGARRDRRSPRRSRPRRSRS